MHQRPSNREIINKVSEALDALHAGKLSLALTKHLVGDLAELELDSAELPALLIELLEEIKNIGPVECYAGTRPPQRSYEPAIRKQELWAYSWHSQRLGKPMYLKFVIQKQCYVYVDCHQDSPPGK